MTKDHRGAGGFETETGAIGTRHLGGVVAVEVRS